MKVEKRKSRDHKAKGLGAMLGLGGAKEEGTASADDEPQARTATVISSAPQEEVNAVQTSTDRPIEVDDAFKERSGPITNEPSGAGQLATTHGAEDEHATSPKSGDSKVKTWLKSHFRRSTNPSAEQDVDKSFVGGATLVGGPPIAKSTTSTSEGKPGNDSMREVALAGKSEPEDMYGASDDEEVERNVSPPRETLEMARQRSLSISSLSSSSKEHVNKDNQGEDSAPLEQERGRRGFRDRLMGLGKTNRKASTESSQGDARDDSSSNNDRQDDDFEEARDTFDEGPALAPPPKLPLVGASGSKGSGSPARDSRFSEEF